MGANITERWSCYARRLLPFSQLPRSACLHLMLPQPAVAVAATVAGVATVVEASVAGVATVVAEALVAVAEALVAVAVEAGAVAEH